MIMNLNQSPAGLRPNHHKTIHGSDPCGVVHGFIAVLGIRLSPSGLSIILTNKGNFQPTDTNHKQFPTSFFLSLGAMLFLTIDKMS